MRELEKQTEIKEKILSLDGRKVFYLEAGSGEPLLLIHSWPTCSKIFLPVIPSLAKDFHIYAPDLPGFGHSQELSGRHNLESFSRFIKKFVNAQKIKKVNLFGVSLGGSVALDFACNYPEIVDKIAVNSPLVYYYPDLSRREKFLLKAIYNLPPLKEILFRVFESRLWLNYNLRREDTSSSPKHLLREIFSHAKGGSKRAVSESLRDVLHCDLRECIKKITAPVLAIAGEKEDPRFIKQCKYIASEIPGAGFVLMKDGTHRLLLHKHEEFSETLVDFFEPHLFDHHPKLESLSRFFIRLLLWWYP